MAVSNYHKQNFSDFASPDSNNPDPLRRNFKFEDKKNSDEYQKKLEDVLSQLKKKDKQPENPFYDNSFQHNLNVPRSKQPDISLDFRNQQLPSISRLSDRAPVSVRNDRREPAPQKAVSQEIVEIEKKPANDKNDGSFRGYDKRSLQNNNNKGSFFDGFGQNSRHNNIVKDYQEYMRNNPIPLKNKRLDDFDEREKDRISLRKKNEQKQAEKDWYAKEIGVGILPGMGGITDNRRGGGVEPHRRQVTSEFKSPQEKFYDYEPTEKVRRGHSGVYDGQRGIPDMAVGRGVTRDELNRVSLDVPGSRLAGIGSRILESERLPQYMRTPQYTPNKEPMNFKFASPQIQKDNLEMGPNLAGKFKEMQGYSYDVDSYSRQASDRKERGYEDFREGSREVKEFPNEERWQNINRPERRNPRDNENNGNNVNWIEERQKKDQDKKDRQKEELQRAYREQIEEKKRKKDEEQRRIMAEERKEEERLRRENEELQKQFQLEMQKKREAEEEAMKANEVEEDEYTKKRLMKKRTRAVEVSSENVMKKKEEVPVVAQDYPIENKLRFEDEQLRLDDFEKDFGRKMEEKLDRKQPVYEFSRDPEMEVQREITRKMNSNLDEQLEKMRRDVDYHAKMLRTELTSYKTQAMVSQDLRQNAQKELERLRDDLKHQQIYANREPVASFDPSQNKNSFNAGKGQRLDTDRSTEKMNIMLPSKSYAKMYSPENEGQNLELSSSAGGLTLDFETKYVPVKEAQESYARNYDLFKEPAKLNELMKKYGVDEEDGNKVKHKNDAAMKKFGQLFPKQANSPQKQDSFSALEAKMSGGLDLAGHGTGELGHYYPKSSTRQVEKPGKSSRKHIEQAEIEGDDEIERIENLLRNYRDPDLKFRDEEKKVVKPIKDGHTVSNKRIINELEHDGFTGRDEKDIKVPVDHQKVLNNEHGGHEEEEDYELKDFEMKDEEEEIGMADEQGHGNVTHHGGGSQDKLVVAKSEKGQINMTNNIGELEDEEH